MSVFPYRASQTSTLLLLDSVSEHRKAKWYQFMLMLASHVTVPPLAAILSIWLCYQNSRQFQYNLMTRDFLPILPALKMGMGHGRGTKRSQVNMLRMYDEQKVWQCTVKQWIIRISRTQQVQLHVARLKEHERLVMYIYLSLYMHIC